MGLDIQDITKTPAGGRWVGLPPMLVAMLRKWSKDPFNDTHVDERDRLGIGPGDGLVFPSDSGTIMSAGNFRKRQFQDAKDAPTEGPGFPVDLPVMDFAIRPR